MDDPRFTAVEIKVGAVLLLTLLLFLGCLYYVAYEKHLFARKDRYFVVAASGQGISKGMTIKFSGYQIGSVDDLFLEEDGSVRVTLAVLHQYRRWIRTDSTFTLGREGMIGPTVLMLDAGQGPAAPPGTSFHLQRQKGLEEVVAEIKPVLLEVSATVTELHRLLASINDPQGKVNAILANVEAATSALNQGPGVAAYLLHDPAATTTLADSLAAVRDLGQRLNTAAANLDRTITAIGGVASDVQATSTDIRTTSADLRATSTALRQAVTDLKEAILPILTDLQATSRSLPRLRRDLDHTIDLGQELLIKLHNTWPLNRGSDNEEGRRPALPTP